MGNKYGIEPLKDFIPYVTGFFAWLGSLNWLLILSLVVAGFRAYVAWKEYKLKERIEDRNDAATANSQTKTSTKDTDQL